MKQTPQELFEQLSKEFSPKKAKEIISKELPQVSFHTSGIRNL